MRFVINNKLAIVLPLASCFYFFLFYFGVRYYWIGVTHLLTLGFLKFIIGYSLFAGLCYLTLMALSGFTDFFGRMNYPKWIYPLIPSFFGIIGLCLVTFEFINSLHTHIYEYLHRLSVTTIGFVGFVKWLIVTPSFFMFISIFISLGKTLIGVFGIDEVSYVNSANTEIEMEAIENGKSELTQTGKKKDDTEIKRRIDDEIPTILIDGKIVDQKEAHKKIDDPEFVKGVSEGTINVEQLNDDEFSIKLLAKIREYARSKSDKPLDDTRTEKTVGETKTGISEVIGTTPGSDEKKQ